MVPILWRHMVVKFDNHSGLIVVSISYFVYVLATYQLQKVVFLAHEEILTQL